MEAFVSYVVEVLGFAGIVAASMFAGVLGAFCGVVTAGIIASRKRAGK